MTGFALDTGALIALERGDPVMRAMLVRARQGKLAIAVPVNVVAQAWRGAPRQAPVALLLASQFTEIVPMDFAQARRIGELCGRTGASDVVDASVVVCAQDRGYGIVTSDPEDLRALDARIPLLPV